MPEITSAINFNQEDIETPNYTQEELEYRQFIITRARQAYNSREEARYQFDDKSYSKRYIENSKNSIAYNPPKLNLEDTRIVTGTTRQKVITQENALLSFNFNADIIPYNKEDLPLFELGKIMEDLVFKTREIEDDDLKKDLRIKEYVQQGDVFVQEIFVKENRKVKKIKNEDNLNAIDWESKIVKAIGKAETRIIPGINFYPGNIYKFFMSEQPFIIYTDLMDYGEAQAKFGDFDRFKNVPRRVQQFQEDIAYKDSNGDYVGWSLSSNLQKDIFEAVYYEDKWNNEYQIMLNGVMMLPVKKKNGKIECFPLTKISPSGEYSISKGSSGLFQNFFYSKPIPADLEVLQNVYDEMLKLLIQKTQYASRPAIINSSTSQVTRDIFSPAKIINSKGSIQPGQLTPAVPTNLGFSASEFNAMEFIKKLIDEDSLSAIVSGSESGDKTLGQIQLEQSNSLRKMGSVLLGFISLEKQLVWKRIYNIIKEYPKLVKRFSIKTNLDIGKNGIKIIEFNAEKANMTSEQVRAIETAKERRERMPVRLISIDPNKYKETLDWTWFVNILPVPKETTELRKVMFENAIIKWAQIPPIAQDMNWDNIKNILATNQEEDPDKVFIQRPEIPEQATQGVSPNAVQRSPQEAQLAQTVTNQVQTPSINTLNQQ